MFKSKVFHNFETIFLVLKTDQVQQQKKELSKIKKIKKSKTNPDAHLQMRVMRVKISEKSTLPFVTTCVDKIMFLF